MSKTLRELAQAAGGIGWTWWTSNSTLRLTSDRGSKDGDVLSAYRAADGVANIDCPEQYRAYIEAASPAAVLNLHAELDRVTAERDALQQRLNAADQRIDDQAKERESLIAYGRSLGLDEASTLCSRMAYDEYYPAASRFRFFVPKAQEKLGNLLIKAANAITNLPDGPYERFRARLQSKASGSASMIDHDHTGDATEKVAQPFTEQFLEDHLGKLPK